jgi:hypothetical protein
MDKRGYGELAYVWDRSPNRRTFGVGIQGCLGSHLARLAFSGARLTDLLWFDPGTVKGTFCVW